MIKNHLIFSLILIGSTQFVYCQQVNNSLQTADSLFQQKMYTQSLALYEEIFENDQKQSPAMLLKMAYINEGLGDYSNALFYLNKYYQQTLNKEALEKMEDLAQKHEVSGYVSSDVDMFLNYYYQYLPYFLLAAIALSAFLFALIYRQKRKTSARPYFTSAALTLMLGLLFYMINFGDRNKQGIISDAESYLMSGPSSGANVVEVVKPGHKVSILGKEDVWVKISWNGSIAYVKENNLMLL